MFDDDFVNPEADTFRITRPDDLPDSSIVGQELTLVIEAFDKEKEKRAVTYDEGMYGSRS